MVNPTTFTFKIKPENAERFAEMQQAKKSTITNKTMEDEKMEKKQQPTEILVRIKHLGVAAQKVGPVELQVLPRFTTIFDENGEALVPIKFASQLLSDKYPGMYEEIVPEGGQRLVQLTEQQKVAIVEKRLLEEANKPLDIPEEGNVKVRNKSVAAANLEGPVILKILPTYSASFDVGGVATVPVEVAQTLLREGNSNYELVKEPKPVQEPVVQMDEPKPEYKEPVRSKRMPKPEVVKVEEPSAEVKADFVKQIVE